MPTFNKPKSTKDSLDTLNYVTRRNQFFKEIIHDTDLDTLTSNIVNYIKEFSRNNRISILIPLKYTKPYPKKHSASIQSQKFTLKACSGVHSINPRGEHSVLLTQTAKYLIESSLKKAEHKFGPKHINKLKTFVKITLTERDTLNAKSPQSIIHSYFSNTSMNWVAAIPLWNPHNHICGILLIEGSTILSSLDFYLLQIQGLTIPASFAIHKALTWNQNWTFFLPKKWITIKTKIFKINCIKKVIYSIVTLTLILNFPLPYSVEGKALLSPKEKTSIPAPFSSYITKVHAHKGDTLESGNIIAQLSTAHLQLKLNSLLNTYNKTLSLLNKATQSNDEPHIHSANLQLESISVSIQRIQTSIQNSKIIAPFDGTIIGLSNTLSTEGKIVLSGEPICTIADLNSWKVKMSVRQQDMALLQNKLANNYKLKASIKLNSDPTHNHLLPLTHPKQFSYGTSSDPDKFNYSISFELNTINNSYLKNDYHGLVKVQIGWKPIYYILFRDFSQYLKMHNT